MKISNIKGSKLLALAFIAIPYMLFANAAHAATFEFTNITNNSTTDLSGQLSVDVTQIGTDGYFTFWNDVDSGTYSSITDIYFDYDPTAVTGWSIDDQSAGVDFAAGAAPANLPGGNGIGFVADYSADSNTPALTANGINATGEYITFLATLSGGYDLLQAMYNGTFQIGLHMQAIDDGFDNSDSYTNVVPIPAAAWLFGSALIGFAAATRRRKSV